jgi:hypothetical protein
MRIGYREESDMSSTVKSKGAKDINGRKEELEKPSKNGLSAERVVSRDGRRLA